MDPGTVEFVRRALALKDVARKGWTRVPGVGRVESVADHSWGVALLALAVADEWNARRADAPAGASAADGRAPLDRARLLELAIVHDIAEAVVGDLVPGDYADRAEKLGMERVGLELLVEGAPTLLRRRILDRFEELATDASPEAKLIHDLDKLEMAFQAERYAHQGVTPDALAPFHESAARGVRDAGLARVLAKLKPGV